MFNNLSIRTSSEGNDEDEAGYNQQYQYHLRLARQWIDGSRQWYQEYLRTSSQGNDEDETETENIRYQDHLHRIIARRNRVRERNRRIRNETTANRRTSFSLPLPLSPLSHNTGDATIYSSQQQAAEEQLEEERRSFARARDLAERRRRREIRGIREPPSGELARLQALVAQQRRLDAHREMMRGLESRRVDRLTRVTSWPSAEVANDEAFRLRVLEARRRAPFPTAPFPRPPPDFSDGRTLEPAIDESSTLNALQATRAGLQRQPSHPTIETTPEPASDTESEIEFSTPTSGGPSEFVQVLREGRNISSQPRVIYAPPEIDERDHTHTSFPRSFQPSRPQESVYSRLYDEDDTNPTHDSHSYTDPDPPQPPSYIYNSTATQTPLPPTPSPPSPTPSPHRLHLLTQYHSLIIPYTHTLHRWALTLSPHPNLPPLSTNTLRPIGSHFMTPSLSRHVEGIRLLERFILSRRYAVIGDVSEDRRNFEPLRMLLRDPEMRAEREAWRLVVWLHFGEDLMCEGERDGGEVDDGEGIWIGGRNLGLIDLYGPADGIGDLEVEREYEADEESMADVYR